MRRQSFTILFVILTGLVLAYWPIKDVYFLSDEWWALGWGHTTPWKDFWIAHYSWSPIQNIAAIALSRISLTDTWPWIVLSVGMHLLNCWLTYRISFSLSKSHSLAGIAAITFALLSAGSEFIYFLAMATSLPGISFMLIAIYFGLEKKYVWSWIAYTLAIMSGHYSLSLLIPYLLSLMWRPRFQLWNFTSLIPFSIPVIAALGYSIIHLHLGAVPIASQDPNLSKVWLFDFVYRLTTFIPQLFYAVIDTPATSLSTSLGIAITAIVLSSLYLAHKHQDKPLFNTVSFGWLAALGSLAYFIAIRHPDINGHIDYRYTYSSGLGIALTVAAILHLLKTLGVKYVGISLLTLFLCVSINQTHRLTKNHAIKTTSGHFLVSKLQANLPVPATNHILHISQPDKNMPVHPLVNAGYIATLHAELSPALKSKVLRDNQLFYNLELQWLVSDKSTYFGYIYSNSKLDEWQLSTPQLIKIEL